MKWGKYVLMFVSLILFIGGCSNDKQAGADASKKAAAPGHTTFLLFEAEYDSDHGSAGSLYIAGEDEEPSKIASDVLDQFFTYYDEDENVLYLTTENRSLYQFDKESGSVKLGEAVTQYERIDEDTVAFIDQNTDLYMVEGDKEAEKVASSVFQYELIGDHLYYTNERGDFRLYNTESREEIRLASDAFGFVLLSDEEDMAYSDQDGMLFYLKNSDSEPVKVSSDPVMSDSIQKMGDKLYYISYNDDENQVLYAANLAENSRPVKVIDGAVQYDYQDGTFYYTTQDSTLYSKKEGDDSAVRLTSDVSYFSLAQDGIYVMDDENALYQVNGDEKKKVGTDVVDFSITPDNDVLFDNTNDELFLGEKKLETELDYYTYYYGSMAFANKKNELYVMEDMGEAKQIDLDLSKYSAVYYQNGLVYTNVMDEGDIAGVWKAETAGETTYIQFHKSGTVEHLQDGEQVAYEISEGSYQSLGITVDGEYSTIRREESGDLQLETAGEVITLTKSTADEAKSYFADAQLRANKESIKTMIGYYVEGFADAVNYGDMYYIGSYIDAASPLYDQQAAFVADMYDKNIKEELVDYTVTEVAKAEGGGYSVTVEEIFMVYNPEAGTESKKKYNNVYKVEEIEGQFLITDLKVSQDVVEENTV